MVITTEQSNYCIAFENVSFLPLDMFAYFLFLNGKHEKYVFLMFLCMVNHDNEHKILCSQRTWMQRG